VGSPTTKGERKMSKQREPKLQERVDMNRIGELAHIARNIADDVYATAGKGNYEGARFLLDNMENVLGYKFNTKALYEGIERIRKEADEGRKAELASLRDRSYERK
jgi:hypothetical protein